MKDQSLWFLENIDVSGLFCSHKLSDHSENHVTKTFKKNEYIYLPDQSSDKIYFLASGRIKIGSYNSSGKEITKALLAKGEVFGELAIISEDVRRDFAIALELCEVCILPVDQMKAMMKDHNSISLFFMKIMGSKVLEMETRLESLVFKDSRSRIIDYLLEMVDKRGQRIGYEWVVRNFITHQEIANLTATSRQTVTTILNELRTKNIITFNRKRLLVRDVEALKNEGM